VSAGRRLLAVVDALPVSVLAVIAGAGSFTHIRDTAAQHGQTGPMSWRISGSPAITATVTAVSTVVSVNKKLLT
jgi:isopentenyl phosphate kinase